MYNNSEIPMLLQKCIEMIMRGVHSNNIYLSSKLLKADCYTLKKRSCIRYTYKQTLITYLHYIRLIDKAPHRNPSLNVAQHSMYFLLLYSYICIRYSYSTHLISMNLNIFCLPNIVIWHVCLGLKERLLTLLLQANIRNCFLCPFFENEVMIGLQL